MSKEQLEIWMRKAYNASLDEMDALIHIDDHRLYEYSDYSSFREWFNLVYSQVAGKSYSWYTTNKNAYTARIEARVNGYGLANQNAARELNKLLGGCVWDAARALILSRAKLLADGQLITAKHITMAAHSLIEVMTDATATGGMVDTGDGTMHAFEGALCAEEREQLLQAHQQGIELSKRNNWSPPIDVNLVEDSPIVNSLFADWLQRQTGQTLKPGTRIQLKWRIIENEPQPDASGCVAPWAGG